jgi:hypothetical protein
LTIRQKNRAGALFRHRERAGVELIGSRQRLVIDMQDGGGPREVHSSSEDQRRAQDGLPART